MSLYYQGIAQLPGPAADEALSQHRQIWWGREEQQIVLGAIIDSATVDSGNSGNTTFLRPGLALGQITATKKMAQWNPYATDGSQFLAGFWMTAQQMEFYGTAIDRFDGCLLAAGNVKAAHLLIPGEANYGISGTDYEFLLREQMVGRYHVDDDLGKITGWKHRDPTAAELTANAGTLTTADHHSRVTNYGEASNFTWTLPAPKPGLEFEFIPLADVDIVLEGPATGEYFVAGAAANSITINDFTASSATNVVRVRAERTAADTYKYIPRPDAT